MKSLKFILLSCFLLGMTACTTVTPSTVIASAPSWDGTEQNSGIIGTFAGGFNVTEHFRDRYNALVDSYGERFAPALRRNAGLSIGPNGTFIIDPEHMEKFVRMNAWRKAGIQPG